LVGAAGVAAIVGSTRQDLVLIAFAITAALTLAVAAAVTAVAVRFARRAEGRLAPVLLEKRKVRTGFAVQLPAWLPLVEVQWTLVEPAAETEVGVERGLWVEWVAPSRRGNWASVVRRVGVGDVTGLWHWDFDHVVPSPVQVMPDPGALETMPFPVGWTAGDVLAHPDGPPSGDPYDMRPYAAGDPIRLVLWKVYARQRELVVRTPERAVSPSEEVAIWLVAGPKDDAAAAAAQVLVQQSDGRSWTLGADGLPTTAQHRDQAQTIIMESARATAEQQGQGLAPFSQALGSGRRVVVLAPAHHGAWVDRVIDAVLPIRDRVVVVVCADAASTAQPTAWWQIALNHADQPDAVGVAARLTARGVAVIVVDRTDGRRATGEQLRARPVPA
jgi:uncharacterized protein (DUF58 family)